MKLRPRTILLALAVWALSFAVTGLCSCTAGYGQGYAFASVGGNASRVEATPGGLTIEQMNNSDGLGKAKELGSEVVTASVIKTTVNAAPKILGTAGDVVEKFTD